MMVSEEAGTVQEDVTSTEASTQSENQGKVESEETKSGRPSALGGAAALATATGMTLINLGSNVEGII